MVYETNVIFMKNVKCPLCQNNNFQKQEGDLYNCSNCKIQFIESNKEEKDGYFINYFQSFRNNSNDENQIKRQEQYKIDSKYFHKNFSGDNILDVGCSSGDFIFNLNFVKNNNYYGIDIDKSGIEVASINNHHENIQFISTDLLDFDSDIKFDAIIFRGTFQYLSNSFEEYILKCKKLLASDGKIFIFSLPNSDSFIYKLLGEKWHLYNANEHKLIFNKDSLEYLSEKYNFELFDLQFPYLETAYADISNDYRLVKELIQNSTSLSVPFWGSMIQCILKNK